MTAERIRYRRVSTRMWGDEKFLALSAPKANARDLWIWLLTGPLTTPVPGVVLTNMAGMADGLEWPVAATKRCWEEIVAGDMATADWSRKLVWLPNGLRHNPPANPNVVKSWRQFLEESVPECDLRWGVEVTMASFLKGLGPTFLKAFERPSGKPFGKQDQDQETGSGRTPQPPAVAGGRVTRAEVKRAEELRKRQGRCLHEQLCDSWAECVGKIAGEHRRGLTAGLAAVS